MPMYQYKCDECNHSWEMVQSVKNRNVITKCPKCNTSGFFLKISTSSIKLKGSCWAKDGYTK